MQNQVNKHICPRCHKCYKQVGHLKRHLRLECGVEKQFKCVYCGKLFAQNSNLTRHYFLVHKVPLSKRQTKRSSERTWRLIDNFFRKLIIEINSRRFCMRFKMKIISVTVIISVFCMKISSLVVVKGLMLVCYLVCDCWNAFVLFYL